MPFSDSNTRKTGKREWWQYGNLHRINGPAIIYQNGIIEYYQNGEFHREDGPARFRHHEEGFSEWYQNGELHRDNGPARYDMQGIKKEWYRKGKKHRIDGPALIWPHGEEWFKHGRRHRESGPAIITRNHHIDWYIRGTRHTFKDWLDYTSDEEAKTFYKLVYFDEINT